MQKRQERKAGRKSRPAGNGKAEAVAALAMKATRRNSVFSTMSARSLCSDDEQAGSYAAVDKVARVAKGLLTVVILQRGSCLAILSHVKGIITQML